MSSRKVSRSQPQPSEFGSVRWRDERLGGYQAGYFYDIAASYFVSYANAAIAGVVNLLVVAALFWYRRQRTAQRALAVGGI
jgi:hypothetical protein